MSELAGLDLKQPSKINWDKFNPQSTYQAPPPAEDANGKPIIYTGTLPKTITVEKNIGEDFDGFMQAVVDVTIVGPQGQNQTVRGYASVQPFKGKDRKTGESVDLNVNGFGKLLRSAGSTAKPQTNEEYLAALKAAAGKTVRFTIDWRAKNTDTGETIKGYRSFPMDAQYGHAQSILHQGDTYNVVDNKGIITGQATVESEVIFANARIKNFVELNKVASAT